MKALSIFSLLVALITGSIPLHAEIKVLALSGSTRKDSYNKKLVSEAADLAKQLGAQVTVIDLKDYSSPFYDEDMNKKLALEDSYTPFHFEHKIKVYLKQALSQEAVFPETEDLEYQDQLIAGNR